MAKTEYNKVEQKKEALKKTDSKVIKHDTPAKGGEHVVRNKPVATVVKKEKRGFTSKLIDNLTGHDGSDSVSSYLLKDIVAPAAKDLLVNVITTGARMLIYGSADGGNSNGYSSYHTNYSRPTTNYQKSYPKGPVERPDRRNNHFRSLDFTLSNRDEAEDVLTTLQEQCNEYGSASIADFYDLLDIESSYTDNTYGWTDLRSGRIIMKRGGGFGIDLPKPMWFR